MNEAIQLELFNLSPPAQKIELSSGSGTFSDNLKLPVHRWFRYSAGFSAAWVEAVLREVEPETVLDPFVGSGTVCLVADTLGINSFGIETHPFVYKLAKGKLKLELSLRLFFGRNMSFMIFTSTSAA